jgi:hypothetical protein
MRGDTLPVRTGLQDEMLNCAQGEYKLHTKVSHSVRILKEVVNTSKYELEPRL